MTSRPAAFTGRRKMAAIGNVPESDGGVITSPPHAARESSSLWEVGNGQVELQVAPWEIACSPGWLHMSATAQGTAIYRELRELERHATETLSLEPVLRAAGSQGPMLRCRWRSILAILRLGRTTAEQQ